MKLSVLLPVYNAGNLLERAIVSILSQDFTDFEFIIIDDASKDDSASVIREFAGRDSRIKPVFHQKNAGLSATLNEGLALASTPLVARMDQDDEALPWRLGTQYAFARNRPNVAAAGSFVYHMGITPKHDTLVRLPVSAAEIAQQIERTNCLYHPSVIMNRAMVLNAGGYREQFKNAEDYDLWLRLSKIHELENIPVPLLRYNFTIDGMTLGRKWEQLYYVYLTQAAFRNPGKPWNEIEQIAKDQHARENKDAFLNGVLSGSVSELLKLGRAEEAQRLVERFSADLSGGTRNEPSDSRTDASEKPDVERLTLQHGWLKQGVEGLKEHMSSFLKLKGRWGKARTQRENAIAALQQEIVALNAAMTAVEFDLAELRRTRLVRVLGEASNTCVANSLNAGNKLEPTEIEKLLSLLVIEGREVCGIWQGNRGFEEEAPRPPQFDFNHFLESKGMIKRTRIRTLIDATMDKLGSIVNGIRMSDGHSTAASRPLGRGVGAAKVRVLVCLPSLTGGELEKLLSQVCRGLGREGIHSTVIATKGAHSFQPKSADWFASACSEVFCLPEYLSSESWKGFIAHLISSRRADILLQAGSSVSYDLLPELKTLFQELKIVDYLFEDAGDAANGRKYDYLVDLRIARSGAAKPCLSENGESEDRVRVIPNGVDSRSETPRDSREVFDIPKTVAAFNQAFSELLRSNPRGRTVEGAA